MRPIKLTLQAFGPFPGKASVDFRAALDQRLFGIYGPTGAGKTSILDAICFAFFGASSGDERKAHHLRSDFVGPQTETFVELIFEIGSKRYFVRRLPKQTLKAKRGGGTTAREPSASLFDATALDVDTITADNPGVVIAERKVQEVDQALVALLGYTASQFRQVVLLPQGQFRALLTAKNDERSQILRGLFDVSLYERLVVRLKEEAGSLESRIKETRALIAALLRVHGVDTCEALDGVIDFKREELVGAVRAQSLACERDSKAKHALADANVLIQRFHELDASRQDLAKLEGDRDKFDALNRRITAAKRAKDVIPLDERAAEAARDAATAAQALQAAQTEAHVLVEKAEKAREALAASIERQPDRETLARRVRDLEAIVEQVNKAVPLRARADTAAELLAAAEHALQEATATHQRLEDELTAARQGDTAARDRQAHIAELKAISMAVEGEQALARTIAEAGAEVACLENAATAAKAVYVKAQSDRAEAEAAFKAAEEEFSRAQSVHLAQKLQSGEPCPVCGSTEHPNPATGSPVAAGVHQSFREAKDKLVKADLAERRANTGAIETETKLKRARDQFAGLAKPARTAEMIELELARVKSEAARLEALPRPQATSAKVQQTQTALATAATALNTAWSGRDQARERANATETEWRLSISAVPEPLRDLDQATTQLQAMRSSLEQEAKRHNLAEKAERDAAQALSAANAKLAHVRESHAEAAKKAAERKDAFNRQRADLGFDSDSYGQAKTDIDQLASLEQSVNRYQLELRSADDRVQRAAVAVKDQSRPDLKAVEADSKAAADALQAADRIVITLEGAISSAEKTRRQVEQARHALAEAENRFSIVGDLCRLADGNNDQRLRLVDFAIAATFEKVLDAANVRFVRISQGRYSLVRKSDPRDGRSRAGLEISVHDAYTDRFRDAQTLSGGEGFMASLSLALGLSDIVQAESGGIRLGAIFIDEGFGHLDDQALDGALATLRDLVGRDRAVGVISHVEAVKQQIPGGFDITRGSCGSHIQARRPY